MTIAATARFIAAAILHASARISTLTDRGGSRLRGRGRAPGSWDEAAGLPIAANLGGAFARVHARRLVRMAKRNCREEEWPDPLRRPWRSPFRSTAAAKRPGSTCGRCSRAGAKAALLIRGAQSDLLTADTAARMQSSAPSMKVALVPGVGHAPELNEPEAVAAIDEFLNLSIFR